MPFHASIAAAVEGLTRSLAAEFATAGSRVNAIAPSLTNTPLADRLLNSPEKLDASNKRHPIGRVGQPAEVAALAALLLSERGSAEFVRVTQRVLLWYRNDLRVADHEALHRIVGTGAQILSVYIDSCAPSRYELPGNPVCRTAND